MSFRRSSTRRPARNSGGRRSSVDSQGSVENPNAYGPFGSAYRDAPAAIEVEDHHYDTDGQAGHSHHHRPDGSGTWHQVQLQGMAQPQSDPQQQHQNFSLPYHQYQHQHQHQHQQSSPLRGHEQKESDPSAYGLDPSHLDPDGMTSSANLVPGAQGQPMQSPYSRQDTEILTSDPNIVSADQRHDVQQHQELERHRTHKGHKNAFDHVHGGGGGHIAQHGEQIPIRLGHLFKRPLVRQWVLEDKLYREVDDREPSQFELFFDLVMVGIIHKLADGAAEAATGLNIAKFILVFYPAWSIWTDVRSYINVSGTDDVWQRMYILIIMILLMGYAANATGIIIADEKHDEAAATGEQSTSAEGATTAEHTGTATVEKRFALAAAAYLVKRSSEGGVNLEDIPLVREIGHTGYWFAEGYHHAISSAISFYLVAKFCRLSLFFVYGLLLPKFRKALWLNMVSLVIISCTYLPLIFLEDPGIIVILMCCGIILELSSRYIVAAAMQILHGKAKHAGHKTYIPAYSLPHMMERMTQFTILVVGEAIMNSVYVAYTGQFGPQTMFWRATLSVTISFLIIWLYFDNDSSRTFVHALKRHWLPSITFTHMHFPLCAGLILMSSAQAKLIADSSVEEGFYWFFSGSIGLVMLSMGILGILHKSLDRWRSSMIPKSARITFRFVLAVIFVILPQLRKWNSVEFLGAYAGLLGIAVAFETFGKLGAVGREYDPVRAEELRQQRKSKHADNAIPMYGLPSHNRSTSTAFSPEKASQHVRRTSMAAGMALSKAFNKDAVVKGPGQRASWHEYDDLTGAERGEEDVGIESELGKIETKEVSTGERWAYVAT